MSEDEMKAIAEVSKFNQNNRFRDCGTLNNSIDIILKSLAKKDRIINSMAVFLTGLDLVDELGEDSWTWDTEEMKEYFYKKVEE
jgi:hypothetical protein